jgi:membrane protein DedA with SNARE-associated domain
MGKWDKYIVVSFNIQSALIACMLFSVFGYSVWKSLDITDTWKAIIEFVTYCAVVIYIAICVYNIKSAKRNNWK